MHLGDEGDREAARRPGKPGLVLDKVERLPCGKGSEGTLAPEQARQRKRFDKKAAVAKAFSVGDYVWVFQNVIPPKRTKKLLKSGGDPS